MVINGGSRSGAGELASHLARVDTNERMEVRELRGLATDDMREGLRQMEGIAAGTRCRKSLYHVNINSGPNEAPLTPEQEARTIERLEQRLHLEGHPRVVVGHVKHGRAHLHVVWSRIDQATMRAVSDSHNYRAHEQVARELEREFGHAQVKGAHDRNDQERPPRAAKSADLQQAARTKQDPAHVTAEVSRLWRGADNGRAFATALEGVGYVLAQGDRRGFCILDQAGGVHSLARRIEGTTTKEVKARLADIELAKLPTVEQARDLVRERARVRESLALPAQERPAARLAGELTRPGDERNARAVAQDFADARRETVRQQIRKDLDRHLQDQAEKPPRAPEMAPREAEPTRAPEAAASRSEPALSPPDRQHGPDFQQQLADSAEYRRERAEITRANDNRAATIRSTVKSETGKEAGRTLGQGAGLLGTGIGRATGGLLSLLGRVLRAASSSRQSESHEDDTRRRPQNQAVVPPPREVRAPAPPPVETKPTAAAAPPRRSVADELADRANSRPAEGGPREPEPPRERERERDKERDNTRSQFTGLPPPCRVVWLERFWSVAEGCGVGPKAQPVEKPRPMHERPVIRLIAAVSGGYVGWVVEARCRLLAYSEATGESVLSQLDELDAIVGRAVYGPMGVG